MNAHQLVFHCPRRNAFPRDRATMRRLVRLLVRVAGARLLAFHVSDTHVHVIVLGTRLEAGRSAQALGVAFQAALGVRLPSASITPIEGTDHLAAALEYVLCNDERHGVVPDPWRESSNLPDLLGARLVAAATIPRVRALLPRVAGAHLRELAGWTAVTPIPVTRESLREHLADAAAAIAARPNLAVATAPIRAAVLAGVHLAVAAGVNAEETASFLGIDRSTVFRARTRAPDVATLATLRRQLDVRAALPLTDALSFGGEPERPDWRTRVKVLARHRDLVATRLR